MKRFISLFLLLSYLLSSPGLVYSMHFCGKTMTGVSVATPPHTCCCPLPKKPAGCCHDQKVVSPLKDVKSAAAQLKLLAPEALPAPPVVRIVRLLALTYPADEPAPRPQVASGPPPAACPAYVRGHAFLI